MWTICVLKTEYIRVFVKNDFQIDFILTVLYSSVGSLVVYILE